MALDALRCNHLAPLGFKGLIRSITRYEVTSSSECISRSCTALANGRSVCWTFGTAWTRASLTMQLTSRVSVFERVYGQKADIASSCCKLDYSVVCQTVWQELGGLYILFHQIWRLLFVANLNCKFPQVVLHTVPTRTRQDCLVLSASAVWTQLQTRQDSFVLSRLSFQFPSFQ